jgi:hypothetical protein
MLPRRRKDFKSPMLRFPIFILLFTLSLSISCSTPSWFPIKKGPPHKANTKELRNKEVVIIDGEEYVKVANPKVSDQAGQSPYLYIPVDEYLSKKETFVTAVPPSETTAKGISTATSQKLKDSVEKEVFPVSRPSLMPQGLKRKVVLTYFDDRSQADETYGDWMAEKLTREVSQRSQRILFVDYQLVKEFLEKGGYVLSDLETPKVLRLLDQAFGIHALVVGHLSGPYVFTTKTIRDRDQMAKAILKIETNIVDTLSGKTLKTLSATNPIIASREKGTYSEEKAKVKAIDLAISDLSKALVRELDSLDWFCRVAKVEGEDIYINAGRLTGLRLGDVVEVFRSGGLDERREQKGKIQISGFFGIDASMGRLIDGKRPDVNDILRLAKNKGT